METIITRTGLSKKEAGACADKLAKYAKKVDAPITKKDKPEPGVYVHLLEGGKANVYTVREVDVKGDIEKLSDDEKAGYCDKGYRISALHSPTHVKVKADLGLQKPGKAEQVRQETLKRILDKLVAYENEHGASGMSIEEAKALMA